MAFARWAPVVLLAVGLIGCSAGGGPPPTQSAPTPDAEMEPEAAPSDVEIAFLANLDDLIAEATDLSLAPCEDLQAITQQNPNLVPSIRGYAAAIKRVSTSQPMLDTEAVKASIGDLDHTMGQLEGALSLCGVK